MKENGIMKNLVMINRAVVNEIEDMVYDRLEYFDEYTYSDALFIVEFALGMKRNYKPVDYMYDIFDYFGIVEGFVHDEEMVEFLIKKHLEHGEDEWGDSMVICDLKVWLDQR
jgi:hypothetical protein